MAYTTIDDPSEYFQTLLYTGNASANRALTNDGNSDLQPDWIWVMPRNNSGGYFNALQDTSRGVTKILSSNTNGAEVSTSAQVLSVQSDGFTVDDNADGQNYVNLNSINYVAWQWKANGGTTSSNSDGSITSTVQANTTAGFSIVTYTGNGTIGATIGHSLGLAPSVVFVKNRDNTDPWTLFFSVLGNAKYIELNSTNSAQTTTNNRWNLTDPSSTVVSLGNNDNVNENTETYLAYCFSEVKGYSKFGSYTGNGNADGPFVYTGFKPAWIMIKRTDSAKNWYIADSTRSPNNVNKAHLVANSSDAEDTSGDGSNSYFDILSNGFKLRQDFSHLNASGAEHIYMCFASSPFVSSKGVPTTAR